MNFILQFVTRSFMRTEIFPSLYIASEQYYFKISILYINKFVMFTDHISVELLKL